MKTSKIRVALQKLLNATFSSVSTDGGVFRYDSNGDLPVEGERVWSVDEEGNEIKVEDGVYKTEEGVEITVEGGTVVKVFQPEIDDPNEEEEAPVEEPVEEPVEDEPTEEPAPEEPKEEPKVEEVIEEVIDNKVEEIVEEETVTLDARIEALEARIAALEERIKELEKKPAAESVEAEFERHIKPEKTGNKEIDRLRQLFA